jgi:hypothetical protein
MKTKPETGRSSAEARSIPEDARRSSQKSRRTRQAGRGRSEAARTGTERPDRCDQAASGRRSRRGQGAPGGRSRRGQEAPGGRSRQEEARRIKAAHAGAVAEQSAQAMQEGAQGQACSVRSRCHEEVRPQGDGRHEVAQRPSGSRGSQGVRLRSLRRSRRVPPEDRAPQALRDQNLGPVECASRPRAAPPPSRLRSQPLRARRRDRARPTRRSGVRPPKG